MSRPPLYSFPPTPQDWQAVQPAVRAYYVNQKLPLKDVRTVLKDGHGFRATDRMIKARLKQWGYLKNAKKEDWHFLALLHHNRRHNGKPNTIFDVRGHRKTVKDLQRFVRNQGMGAEDFLQEARQTAGSKQIPDYIRASTPDSSLYQESPPDDADQEYLTPSPPTVSAQLAYHPDYSNQNQRVPPGRPTNHLRPQRISGDLSQSFEAGVFGSTYGRLQPPIDIQDSAYMSASLDASTCTQIQSEFEMLGSQILQPAPLISRTGDEDMSSWALLSSSPSSSEKSSQSLQFVCSRCNQPSEQHFISLDHFEPHQAVRRDILNGDDHTLHLPISTKDEGSWLWVSRCFLACMCLKKGDQKAADQSLREAAKEFERLLRRKDKQLLTAAGLVMTILHMHDQSGIAEQVIRSAYNVARQVHGDQHPITITFQYLVASATVTDSMDGITSDILKGVRDRFLDFYPPNHEYVIAASHNYSWLLKFEGRLQEAESEARDVYAVSCQVLGAIHMQSITSLAVVAGCIYSKPERLDECIAIFEQVIKQAAASLGEHHPYTLEAKRRLADKLYEQGGSTLRTLNLWREVLWGRVHMLGPSHNFTIGARNSYEIELDRLNMWEVDGVETPGNLEVRYLFSPKSPGSWTRISRRRTLSQRSLPRFQVPDEFDENDAMVDDEDEEVVLVDVKGEGSDSPRSVNEFQAY